MTMPTDIPVNTARHAPAHWQSIGYWLTTAALAAELGVGGIWDITRLPFVRQIVTDLGYPPYFLVLLGSWKLAGAIAVLLPRHPLVKEWAYAGAFFTYTGAITSHLATGRDLGELTPLAVLTALTVTSWALRPDSRRTSPASPMAASRPTTP